MLIYKNDVVAYIDLRDNCSTTSNFIANYAKRNKIKIKNGTGEAKTLLVINYRGEDFLLICSNLKEKLDQQFSDDGYLII